MLALLLLPGRLQHYLPGVCSNYTPNSHDNTDHTTHHKNIDHTYSANIELLDTYNNNSPGNNDAHDDHRPIPTR